MSYREQPLIDTLARLGEAVPGHRPWPRFQTTRAGWRALIDIMAAAANWSLIGLWAERPAGAEWAIVHAALRNDVSGELGVLSLDCLEDSFPSLSGVRPAAVRLERMAAEMFGLKVDGLTDDRLWLDHGTWGLRRPLSPSPEPGPTEGEEYPILPVNGHGLHEIPVGPVHAGIIEPGHFRFTANGETVVRLEQRLGYVHKGIEKLMQGKTPAAAAALACRISGDAAVAHAVAFARAVEAALGLEIPRRAHWLRACMAEVERIANHLGDIGAICNDAAFAFMLAEMSVLRERVLRTADDCFGHRLMMDRIVPGGVTVDLPGDGVARIQGVVGIIRRALPGLVKVYEAKASLQDRTQTTGVTAPGLVNRFGAGGHVGRAAGRGHDSRCSPSYAPYEDLDFQAPVLTAGDVNARVWIRIKEIEQSLDLLDQIVKRMPGAPRNADGATPLPLVPLPAGRGGEGMALVESFRGEIMTWVRLADDGTVARCHPRDPSWFQWPLLEACIEGNIVADFPLCNKSFNCSYSGHDL
jgi:Ni,Fe-hydrogenase III large subunit